MERDKNRVGQELFSRVAWGGYDPRYESLESAEDHNCDWQVLSYEEFTSIRMAALEARARRERPAPAGRTGAHAHGRLQGAAALVA